MIARTPGLIACLVVLLVFLVHLFIAPLLSLGVDEAHYALYALHPDLSYFDHPPMVGWLQMLVAPLGYDEFSVRLMPALLYAIASLQVYRLTGKLYPDGDKNQSLVAVFLLNSAPFLQLMGWGLVPDAPLIVLALFSIELILKISQKHRLQDWLMLGVVFGLAGLSKYTAVFLPLAMTLFLSQQQGLRWLKQLAPWLAMVPALVLISPVLIWNSIHDWASFTYQMDHASEGGWSVKNVLMMQVLQMSCYSILAYIAGIAASIFALRRGRSADWLVIWSVWPFLLVTTWSAGNGELLPNWPALGWALLAPLTAHWLCLRWGQLWVKILALISSVLSVGLIVGIIGFLIFQPLSVVPFLKPVVRDVVGWDQAARKAKMLLADRGIEEIDSEPPVLLVQNWSRGSRIAWYGRPLKVQVLSDRSSQFMYWFGEADESTRGILIRDNEDVPVSGIYRTRGLSCQYLEGLDGEMDGVIVNKFHFYWCQPEVKTDL
ncbi:MAG: glycosyltransferase family 39 protein [Candidatus Endonucleobacter sp. (ex Gigantidas childressi)]|nr:glycosyltransferase family 39 protein [Candidatus Endonucleobacter sp. (ex Gigantidas childressi)]